jgi:hypothetical protein
MPSSACGLAPTLLCPLPSAVFPHAAIDSAPRKVQYMGYDQRNLKNVEMAIVNAGMTNVE